MSQIDVKQVVGSTFLFCRKGLGDFERIIKDNPKIVLVTSVVTLFFLAIKLCFTSSYISSLKKRNMALLAQISQRTRESNLEAIKIERIKGLVRLGVKEVAGNKEVIVNLNNKLEEKRLEYNNLERRMKVLESSIEVAIDEQSSVQEEVVEQEMSNITEAFDFLNNKVMELEGEIRELQEGLNQKKEENARLTSQNISLDLQLEKLRKETPSPVDLVVAQPESRRVATAVRLEKIVKDLLDNIDTNSASGLDHYSTPLKGVLSNAAQLINVAMDLGKLEETLANLEEKRSNQEREVILAKVKLHKARNIGESEAVSALNKFKLLEEDTRAILEQYQREKKEHKECHKQYIELKRVVEKVLKKLGSVRKNGPLIISSGGGSAVKEKTEQ